MVVLRKESGHEPKDECKQTKQKKGGAKQSSKVIIQAKVPKDLKITWPVNVFKPCYMTSLPPPSPPC